VEDHPLDYADFEGVIPEGQYGGGTVMVWDFGTYDVHEGDGVKALAAGKIGVTLRGQKLNGDWTLVRGSRPGDERNWFLIKTGAEGKAISKQKEEHSALSGRTMPQIATQKSAVWQSNREPDPPKKSRAKAAPKKRRAVAMGKAKPKWIEPMKATLVSEPPPGDKWVYELKWDGFRAIAVKDGEDVELISRNAKSLTGDFPELAEAIAKLSAETAVLDGEICALDADGRPTFQLLQARGLGQAPPPLYYYAFDLLQRDGHDLMKQPLLERKTALEELLDGAPGELRYSATIGGNVRELLEEVRARGMEGLIGKLRDSLYHPGVRSKEWVKLKVTAEQEFVIGGATPPQGSRKHFGALLVGYYAGKQLKFAGKVGTGFNEASLKQLSKLMRASEVDECPFSDLPKKASGRWSQGMTAAEMRRCTWCRPELVCQVKFTEWTNDGSLRHPVFLGLREDKEAEEVRRERAAS
jgi:bifunctional non-homologous end joining protein LigD